MTSVCQGKKKKHHIALQSLWNLEEANCIKCMHMVNIYVMCVVDSGKDSQNAVTNTSLGTFITPIYHESGLEFRVSILYLRLSAF